MPPNTRYVGRGTLFGNPFVIDRYSPDPEACVEAFRACISQYPVPGANRNLWVEQGGSLERLDALASGRLIKQLKGKNLCCWCPKDLPCHADVLLALANDLA